MNVEKKRKIVKLFFLSYVTRLVAGRAGRYGKIKIMTLIIPDFFTKNLNYDLNRFVPTLIKISAGGHDYYRPVVNHNFKRG